MIKNQVKRKFNIKNYSVDENIKYIISNYISNDIYTKICMLPCGDYGYISSAISKRIKSASKQNITKKQIVNYISNILKNYPEKLADAILSFINKSMQNIQMIERDKLKKDEQKEKLKAKVAADKIMLQQKAKRANVEKAILKETLSIEQRKQLEKAFGVKF